MGTTRDIAEFARKTTFDDFNSVLVEHTKNVLLSGVGMTLAGAEMGAGKVVFSYVKECAVAQEAGVFSLARHLGDAKRILAGRTKGIW